MVSSCRAVVHGLLFPTWKSSRIPVYIFRCIHRMQRTLLQHSSALSQPKPIQWWTPIKGVQLITGVTAGETSIWSDESHTQCFLGGDSKQSIMLQTMAVQHGRRAWCFPISSRQFSMCTKPANMNSSIKIRFMFSPRQSNKSAVLFMFKRRKYMSLQKLLAFSKALSLSRGFIKSKLLWNLSLWGDTLFFACACMCCVSVLCRIVVWTWKPQPWGQDLVYSSASGFSRPTGSQDAVCLSCLRGQTRGSPLVSFPASPTGTFQATPSTKCQGEFWS